jgi:hypothetical protein
MLNLLGENADIVKNAEVLLNGSTGVDILLNAEKPKHMFMSCHQTTGRNCYVQVGNKYYENVEVQIFGNGSNR